MELKERRESLPQDDSSLRQDVLGSDDRKLKSQNWSRSSSEEIWRKRDANLRPRVCRFVHSRRPRSVLKINDDIDLVYSIYFDTHLIVHMSLARTPKSLNSEHFSLFHLITAVVLDERDLFIPMNAIPFDIMARDTPESSHREGLASYLNLIALHDFLDSGPNVTHPRINTCFLFIRQI
jgi:hypothetical protein